MSYYDEFTAVNQISSVSKQYKIGRLCILYIIIYNYSTIVLINVQSVIIESDVHDR